MLGDFPLARKLCHQAEEVGNESALGIMSCAKALGGAGDLARRKRWLRNSISCFLRTRFSRSSSADDRSIIERKRGNSLKAVDLLAPVTQYPNEVIFLYIVGKLTWLQESTPRLPPISRKSSIIADGPSGNSFLRWLNSVWRKLMRCKGTRTRAAKPTMLSLPLGKTPTPISRS